MTNKESRYKRRKWGKRRGRRLSMLDRWRIEAEQGWGPHPLSEEKKAMQDARRIQTDSVEAVKEWLARNGISEEQFRQHPLYDLLRERYPHLKHL